MEQTLIKEKEETAVPAEDGVTKVCFVCTGNTCRSPMAAALLNHLGKGRYKATSAGLYANEGEPISVDAVLALRKRGIEPTPGNEYDRHTAKNLSGRVFEENDVVVGISQNHAMAMMRAFPFQIGKITTFDSDVPDPFMKGPAEYEKCLATLEELIRRRFLTEEK